MRNMRNQQQGFTLVEVLVAMLIMSILSVMAWKGVDSITRTRTTSQKQLEQLLRINTVLSQFEQDLNFIQKGAASVPDIHFDGASLQLTRRAPGGLQIVVWSLRAGNWFRWAGPTATTTKQLQSYWQAGEQLLGNEPGQLRALVGLSQWQIYCFRGNSWSNCQSSADVAIPGASSNSTAPEGVRIVLSLGEESGFNGNLTRDIALLQ